jgi:transposase
MRYELTDYEWAAIKPMLPRQPLAEFTLGLAEGKTRGLAGRCGPVMTGK